MSLLIEDARHVVLGLKAAGWDDEAKSIEQLIFRFEQLEEFRRNPIVQIDPAESECLEIRFLEDPPEVVVLRHGMSFPEGGEAVHSELLDPDI